jgi:hypothetical protein
MVPVIFNPNCIGALERVDLGVYKVGVGTQYPSFMSSQFENFRICSHINIITEE